MGVAVVRRGVLHELDRRFRQSTLFSRVDSKVHTLFVRSMDREILPERFTDNSDFTGRNFVILRKEKVSGVSLPSVRCRATVDCFFDGSVCYHAACICCHDCFRRAG